VEHNFNPLDCHAAVETFPEHTHLHLLLLSLVIHFDYTWLRQWRGPKCEEEEQTTQWPKRKSTKGQTTI
jgi:hypothetical protein